MKKLISFLVVCLIIANIIVFMSAATDFYREKYKASIKIDATRITGLEQETDRLINATNDIVFKCDTMHEILIDENGDFIFSSKDNSNSIQDVVISCNKTILKAYYYSYDDEYICYTNNKGKEWINIYSDYCKKDCYYALIFIEDNEETYYAKFTRERLPE